MNSLVDLRAMPWFKYLLSKLSRKRHETNSGKSFDKVYNDLGAFQYNDLGFTITYEGFNKTIKWNDITQLNAFKRDLLTIDKIEMEIVYGDKFFTISEDLPGWYQFVLKTKEVFPEIPKDWDFSIIQPPFARNFTTLYEKTKRNDS